MTFAKSALRSEVKLEALIYLICIGDDIRREPVCICMGVCTGVCVVCVCAYDSPPSPNNIFFYRTNIWGPARMRHIRLNSSTCRCYGSRVNHAWYTF